MSTKRLYVGVIASPFHAYYPFFNVQIVRVNTTMADKQHIRARLKRREIEPIFLWIDTATIHSPSLSDLEEDYQWIVDALHNTLTIHPTAALFVSDQSVYRLLYSFLKIKLPHVILPKPDMRLSASFLFDYVEYDRYGLFDLCMCHLN